MSLNLKPNLLIGHLLPGCFFLLLWLLAYNHWSITDLKNFFHEINATELIGIGIILLIAAFLFGEIFDSTRDGILEYIFEKLTRKKIKWDIFFDPSPTMSEKLTKLEDNCFTWYVFNLNSALSLIAGGIVTKIHMEQIGYKYIFPWIISIGILIIDALVLRKELVTHSNNP
jgi:hypothetical protein